MKILVLSLLRLGDIVLSAPVLRDLRSKYPEAEIHLLINSQFKQVSQLLPYIDRTFLFERDKIQRGLGEATTPLFESFDRLSDLLDDLNSQSYDWVINLTHNRISGWLMDLLAAQRKSGLCLDPHGRASFGTPWFRYLNNQVDAEGGEVFHYTDVFRFALEMKSGASSAAALVESAEGRREASQLIESFQTANFIAVQPLTSDAKKDFGLARFEKVLRQMSRTESDVSFAILGAPFEREKLEPFVENLKQQGVNAHLAILSFEGAFSFLKKARLLLTGDTSIKHLGAIARTPLVEISLGSSDLYRTGPYSQGSVIIQSKELCVPCVHSKGCHRQSHACAEGIPPEVVAMVASEVAAKRFFQLKTIAKEYAQEVEILKVQNSHSGFWAVHSVIEPLSEVSIGRWVSLTAQKLWLDSRTDHSLSELGSEIRNLQEHLDKVHPETSEIEWRHLFSDFERQASSVEGRINGFKVGLHYLRGCFEDPKRMNDFVRSLISFREKIRHAPFLNGYRASLDQVIEDDISPPFVRFRRMNDLVAEIEKRTEISLRLVRGLQQGREAGEGMEKT